MDDRFNILTPRAAESLLAGVRPGHRVTEVAPRAGGMVSPVCEVRFAGAEPPVIVKVYGDDSRWKATKEAHVYGLLQRHGVGPTPRILRSDRSAPELDGRACVVMTLLTGQPLGEVSEAMSIPELREAYRRMGEILATFHSIGQDAFGYVTDRILDPQPTNTAYMTGRFAEKLREFAEHGGDGALHDAVERHVAERTELFAHCDRAVLCHNDFHEGNILVERDDQHHWRVTGFVDVENTVAADPLLDLAKTFAYSIRGDQTKFDGLLEGYGAGAKANAFAERLDLYRLYHALELWDFFAFIGRIEALESLADDMRKLTGCHRQAGVTPSPTGSPPHRAAPARR